MPRTVYVSCTLLKVKPTFAKNSYIVQPEFKIVKISLFSFIHDNNYSIVENLALDWLVVQLRLQFFAVSNFSNGFVEILVDDVLPLGSVNICVIFDGKKINRIKLDT